MSGVVYLIGSGPGDAELITVKGLRVIKEADVIVYDRLINLNLLNYAKEDCQLINVGKAMNNHTLPQDKINELLCEKALTNKVVVRLKGGDPFIFGRGGEEGKLLAENNISFEVVPGISSLSAVPAYNGIPITHRGVSNSFHVFTGHEEGENSELSLDFTTISKLSGTLIFFMGLSNITKISNSLISEGKSKETPVAVISSGTYGTQKIAIGSLEDIHTKLENIKSPALIVVGNVINLREHLKWFETKPLFGKKIVVTRSKNDSNELAEKLNSLGAYCKALPLIDFKENDNLEEYNSVYVNLKNYNYVVFNSVNAVKYFMKTLWEKNKDVREIAKAKFVAIGPATEKELSKYYLKVDYSFNSVTFIEMAEEVKKDISKEDNVLIITSSISDKEKYSVLKESVKTLDVLVPYETVYNNVSEEDVKNVNNFDIITFYSPSAVNNFFNNVNNEDLVKFKSKQYVVIGKTTEEALRGYGIEKIYVSKKASNDGVIEVIQNIE
ncbi:MAG: uroporphyrinogen-III C-methyltransferase [Clostridiaceae bacterium]